MNSKRWGSTLAAAALMVLTASAMPALAATPTTTADLVTHNSILIKASPATIWPQIVEPNAWKMGAKLHSESGEKGKVGERFKAVMGDQVAFYVTNAELIPQQRRTIRITLADGSLMGYAIWELVPQGASTLVKYDVYCLSTVPLEKPNATAAEKAAAGKAYVDTNYRRFADELAALKTLIEGKK